MIIVSLGSLFEILSVIFCLHYLYGERLHLDAVTVCFVLSDVIWMSGIYYLKLGQNWSLMMYLAVVLYCRARFRSSMRSILIDNILTIAVIGILQTTIMVLFRVLLKIEELEGAERFLTNLIMFAIVVGILKKCKLKELSDILKRREKLVVASLSVMSAGTMLCLLAYKHNEGFDGLYYAVLGVSGILIIIAAVDIGKHRMKVREAEAELRMHRLYEASFRELIDDICARQHEFDNHINTIYSQHHLYKTYELLVEAQKKYCREVTMENRYNKLLSKGNPIILAFLYGKFSEIERRGIEISYKVNISELESSVPVYKIVELLGNLLNNAADAVEGNGTGSVRIKMLESREQIEIEVYNESEEISLERRQKFFEKRYSEKGQNRGYGLYNVKRICNEYGIEIVCDNKEIDGKNYLMFSIVIMKK